MDIFTRSYIETLLWSEHHEEEGGDASLQSWGYDADDIAPEALASIVADCEAFQRDCADLIPECGAEQAGYDFLLTRNGHGAGFWDGDWPVNGEALTEECRPYGPTTAYVGDDGLIYVSP